MKTKENASGESCAADVGELLTSCKVRELPACKRAGIATSTLHRWRKGSTPKPGQVDVLRRVIMEIADESGTLPTELASTLAHLRETVALPVKSPLDLEARVGRLERAVGELGAVL